MIFSILIREYVLGPFGYNPRLQYRLERRNLNTKNMRFDYFFVNLNHNDVIFYEQS